MIDYSISLREVFQLESCGEFLAFSRNRFAIIPRKVGISIRQFSHFVPKSFAHFLYNTIMGVAKWERYLWWLSLFCESVKWERFWPFLIERSPCIMFYIVIQWWYFIHRCESRTNFRSALVKCFIIGWHVLDSAVIFYYNIGTFQQDIDRW